MLLVRCPSALLLALPFAPLAAAQKQEPAPIELEVDASDAPRHLLHARLVIPATPGPLTLSYPK